MFFSKLFKNGSSQNAVYQYAIETTGKEELQDLILYLEEYANEVLKADCVIEAKSDLKFGKVFDLKDKIRASFGLDFVMYCDGEKTTDKVLNTFNGVESAYGGIISLKKATKRILKAHSTVVESLLEKGLPIASDDVAILADFQVMQDFVVDGEWVSQGVAVFMIDVYKTMPMVTSAKKPQGRVFDVYEDDLELDDLQKGDIIKGYIWGGSGYHKLDINFTFDGRDIIPATKDDWNTLAQCWRIDKKACEDFTEYANGATSSVNAIIILLTATESYIAEDLDIILEFADFRLSEEQIEYIRESGDIWEFASELELLTTLVGDKNTYYVVAT